MHIRKQGEREKRDEGSIHKAAVPAGRDGGRMDNRKDVNLACMVKQTGGIKMAKADWKVREVSIKLRDGTVKPVAELTRKQRLSLQDAAMERAGYKRIRHEPVEVRT